MCQKVGFEEPQERRCYGAGGEAVAGSSLLEGTGRSRLMAKPNGLNKCLTALQPAFAEWRSVPQPDKVKTFLICGATSLPVAGFVADFF